MSCWGLRVSGSRGLVRLFLRPSLGLRVSGSSWGLLGVWLVPQGLVVSRSSWGVFSGSRGLNLQLLTISRWTVLFTASGQRAASVIPYWSWRRRESSNVRLGILVVLHPFSPLHPASLHNSQLNSQGFTWGTEPSVFLTRTAWKEKRRKGLI